VVHFRRAVVGSPNTLTYHMALTAAYMGLKRYERAESALREAQKLAPGDPKVQELAELIASKKPATMGQLRVTT
jgi:Flp pilus assembly protein TadD